MREALAKAGYAGRPRVTIEPERYKAFFEAHIEQGDTLETEKLRIGVVTAIVAIWQYGFTVTGEQNHAGTTSMTRRRDAGLALVRLLAAIDKRFPEICGPRTVWTTGRITLEPGSHSIIPGRAESLFQLRDADPAVLDRLHAELFRLVDEANRASRCELAINVISQSTPAKMDERLMQALDTSARAPRARQAHPHAERRRPRRAMARAQAARRHDVRAEHRRHQPSLEREHRRTRTSCSARRCSPTRSRMR